MVIEAGTASVFIFETISPALAYAGAGDIVPKKDESWIYN